MTVQDWAAVGIPILGGIIWAIRLEGKIDMHEDAIKEIKTQHIADLKKEVEKLEIRHNALDSKIVDKLSVIEKSLAKIEGRLSIEAETR